MLIQGCNVPDSRLQVLTARLPTASVTGGDASGVRAPAVPAVPTIVVAGLAGVNGQHVDFAGCNGNYTEVRQFSDRPLYRKVGGDAIIYFRDYWKMNAVDAVGGWYFDVKAANGPLPPMGVWGQSGYPKERPAAKGRGLAFAQFRSPRASRCSPTLSWKPAVDDVRTAEPAAPAHGDPSELNGPGGGPSAAHSVAGDPGELHGPNGDPSGLYNSQGYYGVPPAHPAHPAHPAYYGIPPAQPAQPAQPARPAQSQSSGGGGGGGGAATQGTSAGGGEDYSGAWEAYYKENPDKRPR